MSLLLKKYLDTFIMDFAFLILESISASSFSKDVIKEPRYLNVVTK